jgi:hypothetical protein
VGRHMARPLCGPLPMWSCPVPGHAPDRSPDVDGRPSGVPARSGAARACSTPSATRTRYAGLGRNPGDGACRATPSTSRTGVKGARQHPRCCLLSWLAPRRQASRQARPRSTGEAEEVRAWPRRRWTGRGLHLET